jgi:hypothetical protein
LVTNKKGTREKKKERGRERERKREKEREKRERERERKCLYGFKSVLAFSSVPTIKSPSHHMARQNNPERNIVGSYFC